uniref:Uncharacterized protein n=1 Tax=Spironucleus salmonicida TaxID=348837 RepID=V6LLM0_9EUKA|eukprot:EST45452.1 Hypothetical protein SS50377_14604 [Spironucleus salmonicida]
MGIGVELKVYVTCVAQVFIAGDAVLDRLLPADAADSWRRVGAGDALGAGGHVGTARAVLYAGIGAQEKARSTLSAGVGLRALEAPRKGGWFGGAAVADAGGELIAKIQFQFKKVSTT